jgi:hypothetical protein
MSENAIATIFFATFFIFLLLILLLTSTDVVTEPLGW